jgi:uncharacterized protein (DUF433 family)
MALDWSQCPAVVTIPGKAGSEWVFKGTRMPVATVFENLQAGATIDEITEWFHVNREQIAAVLEFASQSLETPHARSSSVANRISRKRALARAQAAGAPMRNTP